MEVLLHCFKGNAYVCFFCVFYRLVGKFKSESIVLYCCENHTKVRSERQRCKLQGTRALLNSRKDDDAVPAKLRRCKFEHEPIVLHHRVDKVKVRSERQRCKLQGTWVLLNRCENNATVSLKSRRCKLEGPATSFDCRTHNVRVVLEDAVNMLQVIAIVCYYPFRFSKRRCLHSLRVGLLSGLLDTRTDARGGRGDGGGGAAPPWRIRFPPSTTTPPTILRRRLVPIPQ